jgi:phosphoribosyl 1,2-cyclic phosphodiesterase
VDAGLSAKALCAHLESLNTPPSTLAGILLTHEHGDHVRGLKILSSKHAVPIFTTPLTARELGSSIPAADWRLFQSGSTFDLGDFHIASFSVPHDAADPVGYVLSHGDRSFAVATDLGHPTRQVSNALRGVNGLLLESNHDETLLQNDTKRPWSVKQRIMSRHGHLSNQSAATLISEIASPSLSHVLLAHLSEDCNSPDLAAATVRNKLAAAGLQATQVLCPGAPEHPLPCSVTL